MSEIIYKEIKGYENLYLISNTGVVYSLICGRELRPKTDYGYCRVCLCKNKVKKCIFIHRLVAGAFIENPENKKEVDHIDRNRQNNNVANLRWVTHVENQQNRGMSSNNITGVTGVSEYYSGKYLYYLACIKENKKVYKKTFPRTDDGLKQATEWYKIMKKEHHIN